MFKQSQTWLVALTILLFTLSTVAGPSKAEHNRLPRFMDYWLAGSYLLKALNKLHIDPKTNYCLIAVDDRSDRYHRLMLTMDLQFAGYDEGGEPGELTRFKNTFHRV